MSEGAPPRLLLVNDDGIDAPGLKALADALRADYDVLIVAPHRERSGAGHAITVLRDLRLERVPGESGDHWGWSFQGKPADCVKVGVTEIARDRPVDMVVSGINMGQNLGINILYSGTVAAAREGAILGIPSVAISQLYYEVDRVDFAAASQVARRIVRRVFANGLPPNVFLNVNVPPAPFEALRGYVITRMGDSGFRDKFHHVEGGPETGGLFRNVGRGFERSSSDAHDMDDHAVHAGYVSITPLHVDATAHEFLDGLQGLAEP